MPTYACAQSLVLVELVMTASVLTMKLMVRKGQCACLRCSSVMSTDSLQDAVADSVQAAVAEGPMPLHLVCKASLLDTVPICHS